MPTSYTSLLGLALPVTGELSGTWGDTVNNYITSFLDASVAGTQTISGSQTAVTLSVTNGSSLVTAGSGATGSAQFQIINCTGNPAGLLTITAPASSRQYIIINATSTSQSVKIVGVGPTTGVTLVSGEKAHVAWNGSDFVKIATQSGTGEFVTVDTTNLEVTNIKAKDGTAAATIADSTGAITVSTLLNVDNLRLDGNTLSSTDSNGNVVIAPNGTGDVQLDADTVRVGDSAAAVTLTSNGAGALTVTTGGAADLVLNTNSGTNSGSITIGNGTNGNITVATNGTGDFYVDADTMRLGDSNANATITTNGTGDLILNTNSGTNSGSITIEDGVNGNIIIAPNGTGQVQISNAALDLTTIEVTNIKAKDGTASITLADSTGVASFIANPVLSAGTANGVLYLSDPGKVATSGSALTFDGTDLSVNGRFVINGTVASAPANGGMYRLTVNDFTYFSGKSTGAGAILSTGDGTATIQAVRDAPSNSRLIFEAGAGSELMRLTSTGLTVEKATVINESGGDNDFRVEGDTDTHLIFADASTDRVGIGTNQPAAKLEVSESNANSVGARVTNTSQTSQYLSLSMAGSSGHGVSGWDNTGIVEAVADGVGSGTRALYLSAYNGPILFATNGRNERARITSTGQFQWSPDGTTQAMTLDASGNLVVGATSTSFRMEVVGPSGDNIISLFRSGDATAANNAGGGFRSISSATATSRVAQLWLDADGANFSGGDYFYIQKNGNSGTVEFNQFSNAAMTFLTNNAERAVITSSGNLGIGTNNPINNGGYGGLSLNGTSGALFSLMTNGTETGRIATLGDETSIQCKASTGYLTFVQGVSGGTERARITSGGDFQVGTAVANSGISLLPSFSGTDSSGIDIKHPSGAASGDYFETFQYNAGVIGSITQNGTTGVLYNITSDYRLKNVLGAISDSGARIDALEPVEYEWKANGSRTRGFLAHKFQEVYPSSVTGTKDAVDAEGKPVYQAMQASTSEVIADLVAEIQSLRARVAQLESKGA